MQDGDLTALGWVVFRSSKRVVSTYLCQIHQCERRASLAYLAAIAACGLVQTSHVIIDEHIEI